MKEITEHKQTETSLAQLAAIVEYSGDAIISKTLDGIILSWNKSAEKIFGYQAEEIIGQPITRLIPSDRMEEEQHILESVQQGKTADQYETVRLRKDGKRIDISATVAPLKDSTNRIIGASVTNRDISDRKRVEESLRRYERIVAANIDAICLLDRTYTYQLVNQTYLQWHQQTYEAVIGHTVSEVLGTELFNSHLKAKLDQCLTGEVVQYQLWVEYPKLGQQFISITYTPYYENTQTVAGVVATLRNVTGLKQAEIALQQSEERLQLALEASGDGLWDWNITTGEVYYSPQYMKMLGYEVGELPNNIETWDYLTHPDDKFWVLGILNANLQNISASYSFDYRVRTKSGGWKWVADYGKVVARDDKGQPLRMIGTHRDVHDRKQAEQQLELQAVITRNMAEGICLVRADDATIVYANPKFEQMFGYDAGELNGRHVSIVNYAPDPEGAEAVNQAIRAAVLQNREATYEVHNVKKDGTGFWCSATTSVFNHPNYGDVLVAVHQDITDRKQAEERIAASLKEKEVLLKEIHHRVKNNLGIVTGLLQIQARRAQDSASTAILQDSQNRIASIALVHEKLYRSENFANIDFSQYLQDLTIYLFDSYNISSNQIALDIEVESVSLEIETAIPCGLIVNELVSNALKHAFPGNAAGEIQVRLAPSGTTVVDGQSNRLFTLVVRDNGIRLPNDFDPESTRTLGISLVQGLVAQIRGTIEIDGQHGTEVKVTFREGGL